MQTDRTLITIHKIQLRTVIDPSFILEYFRKNGIKYYVYEIRHFGYILKYGYSSGAPGERLYRQIANIPSGWNKSYRSPSGKDFQCVCEDFETQYGCIVDKNNIEVVIHDMTNYKFEYSFNPLLELRRFEAEFIESFKHLHGERPIGNLKDEDNALDIRATSDKTMSEFFIV